MRGASSGWRDAVLALGAYAAYLGVRRAVLTPAGRARAHRNARRLVAIERRLGIHVEPAVQRAALRVPSALAALHAGYALANVALSVGWLISRRGRPRYAREQRAALAAFLGALPVFLAMPTAPPRTQDGFVDTMAMSGIDIEHPFLVRFYNPVAAMPSHHVAFAVVTAGGMSAGRPAAWRALATAYPAVVSLVVLATGNHYVLDVAAGAALGAAARRLTR